MDPIRLRAAAFRARLVYPGPVGELITQELMSRHGYGSDRPEPSSLPGAAVGRLESREVLGRGAIVDDRQHVVALRAQMSNVCSMFALAMVMFDRIEEPDILRLAVSSIDALGPYHAQGSYVVDATGMHGSDGDDRLVAALMGLGGADGTVEVPGAAWSGAFPMRAVSGHTGYLVVSADREPSIDQRFLLTTLAHLTGAALVSADLHRRERTSTAELGLLNARLESTNEQLQGAVTDLQQRQRIHEVLTRVAAYGGGAVGIAEAVHDLTGLAVVVEDRFGNLLAWAGGPYPRKVDTGWSVTRRTAA